MNLAAIILLFCGAMLMDLAVGVKLIDLGQQGLFEGDIQVPKRNRNGILAAQRWPNNTIYYEYGTSWTQDQIDMIQGAIKEIQDNTCIKFVKRTNQPNYISIYNGKGCSSPVGYMGNGKQQVSLEQSSQGSCWAHRIVVHELLHTVGLWHEQSRYDRDDYISINMDNVDFCKRHNFDIEPGTSSNTYGVPYNYLSIMHYDKTAFSPTNREITITTIDPNFMDEIGNQPRGAPSDYDKVKRIYQCGIYQNFVAPPVRLATAASTSNAGSCVNVDCYNECPAMAASGYCQSMRSYMEKSCPKSCNTCSATATAAPPTGACNDMEADCATLAASGYCTAANGWTSYMTQSCPKSCGLCSGGGPAITCADKQDEQVCKAWAIEGECTRIPTYMNLNCVKSCGLCAGPATICADKEDEQVCQAWASVGYCTQIPDHMNAHCAKSCGKC